jgi:hypothetical protein
MDARETFGDMNQNRTPWYGNGLAFQCTQCGRCCSGKPGYVWVDEQEIRQLATAVGLDLEEFRNRFVRSVRQRQSLIEYPDGDCIFLDPHLRTCTVYEARPRQCRTWPFWNRTLANPQAWSAAAESCPGCNRGPVYSLTEIEIRRRQCDV